MFAEHEITLEVLPDLTEADIDRLALPTGPRRRLMIAVQALGAATRAQGSARACRASCRQPGISHDADRRQLTVMFCDLVGSTALAERLDPEELRELMQAYRKACGEVVARYDGHVAQYLGDGLMVYFGWPSAHEDDAERSVRAALEIVQAVKGVQRGRSRWPFASEWPPERWWWVRLRERTTPRPSSRWARRPTWRHGCRVWPDPMRS